MRATVVATGLALAATVSALGTPPPPVSAAPVAAPSCQSHGYGGAKCTRVPAHGRFVIPIPGRAIVLVGHGSVEDAGTIITVAPVAKPCASTRAGAFKVFTDGPIPPLVLLTPGTLYRYNEGTGMCERTSEVTGAGIYEVVYHGGSQPGAGTAHRKSHKHSDSHRTSRRTGHQGDSPIGSGA